MVETAEVEKRVELVKSASIEIGTTLGGVMISSVEDLWRIAKALAGGQVAVPLHCRDREGTIFALCLQALEWRMPIMSVINKSYVVNNRGVERIAFESQLIHAIIERNAPLRGRLRYEILGEGDERRCKVWGTFRGEDKPHEYISEPLAKLRDARGRNDAGQVKGSPLWEHQPGVQLFYSASRQWARLFCPDVILGAYTPEDPQYEMRDVTPVSKADEYADKLRASKAARVGARGFDAERVIRDATAHTTVVEGEVNPDPAEKKEAENEVAKGSDGESVLASGRADVHGRGGEDRDENGRQIVGGDNPVSGPQPAGHGVEGEQGDLLQGGGKAQKPKGKRK